MTTVECSISLRVGLAVGPYSGMALHADHAADMDAHMRLAKHQPAGLMFGDAMPERPCSSNSADSISASEAFSTAALESDTSEGQPEAPGRLPGMHMQARIDLAIAWVMCSVLSCVAFTLISVTDTSFFSSLQAAVRTLLMGVGEDPDRQGLRDTPKVLTCNLNAVDMHQALNAEDCHALTAIVGSYRLCSRPSRRR